MSIAKIVRAVRNQYDPESAKDFLVGVGAAAVLMVLLIVGIVTQPDKGMPIILLGVLLMYLCAGGYWMITDLLTKQKNEDYLSDLARRKVEYRAQLDLDPTLSEEDKQRLLKGAFMMYEPIWS